MEEIESQNNQDYFNYSAERHFSDYINNITKEPDIPDDLLLQIQNELPFEFTKKDIKNSLKKLGLSKYFEYHNFIYRKLSNKKDLLPYIDNNTKEDLVKIFKLAYKINKEKFPRTSSIPIVFVIAKILCILNAPEDIKKWFHYNVSDYKKIYYESKWTEIEPELIQQIASL